MFFFLENRSKTFWKVPCVSTRASWKLRKMSRSPSQMTTTAPAARARVTSCLRPQSRYRSSNERRHIDLFSKVTNKKTPTKVPRHDPMWSLDVKYHRWPEPGVLHVTVQVVPSGTLGVPFTRIIPLVSHRVVPYVTCTLYAAALA